MNIHRKQLGLEHRGHNPGARSESHACTLQSALVCEGSLPHPWASQPQACRVSSWKPMLFQVNHPVSLGLWILWLKDISELLGSLGFKAHRRRARSGQVATLECHAVKVLGGGAACRDSGEGRGPRAWEPLQSRDISCTGEGRRVAGREGGSRGGWAQVDSQAAAEGSPKLKECYPERHCSLRREAVIWSRSGAPASLRPGLEHQPFLSSWGALDKVLISKSSVTSSVDWG